MNKWKFLVGLLGVVTIALFSGNLFFNEVAPKDRDRVAGFNLVAPREVFSMDSLKKVKAIGADWVAVVPYAFCSATTAEITFDHPRQWWGEKPNGISETIKMAKSLGLKVMLKPHLWVGGQGWAGDLDFQSDSLWKVFEQQYTTYISTYAKIADSLNVDLFCIGTEIRQSTAKRKDFWLSLIEQTKADFQGELTYAANWDEYTDIEFWDDLDYIGIDAYFPLSEEKKPSKENLISAWQKPKQEMKKVSQQYKKPILFTEFGYESTDYNTMGHWKLSKDSLAVNFESQKIAFESVFDAFRTEEWWRGGFIWKWHLTRSGLTGRNIKAYTPQDKPALKTIETEFKNNF